MAENQDLEQNQNVTENVNVPEAENQPENVNVAENVVEIDNLAVVSYVTQNDEHIQQTKNVVHIEHASENEDLDQYLVYLRNTWAYDITITVHCKLKFIAEIRRVLEEQGELARFKRGCFGHYLDLPGHMQALFQAQYIHNLLLRQIQFPGASEDEMWFALGKNKVRLGKREFCLCNRLKFGVLPDIFLRDYIPVPDGIHIRYFYGQGSLLLQDVLSMFFSGSFKREGDAFKMALVLFANNILFGQDYRRQVMYWLMTLVEDIEAFNSFQWGHYIFKMTLHYIRSGFKFWAMEVIPSMWRKLGNRFANHGCPRFKK
ncbi:hypothetical protein Q3G72_024273 [Acer saccharum]|nr:hypothetical protein Q3G72_024273 [Acer saccharum]